MPVAVHSSPSHALHPVQDLPAHSVEVALDQEVKNLHQAAEENVGALIVNLQRAIEIKNEDKINHALGEVRQMQDKINDITSFLEFIEAELAHNPQAKTINLSQHSALVEKLHAMAPDRNSTLGKLLGKTEWSRDEAELLTKTFSRRSEQEIRQVNQKLVQINRHVEERHEFLSIAREILKMLRELLQGITNRRA